MRHLIFITLVFSATFQACEGQTESSLAPSGTTAKPSVRIGGPCEDCDLIYAGMPDTIHAVDTSDGWRQTHRKLIVAGKLLQPDGRTPAPNVVLYYWQTDSAGLYRKGEDSKSGRHGHIRGWVKSDKQGKYALYTNRPAAYPGRNEPEHIHFLVKEPNIPNEYYIDDLVFDDDPLFFAKKKSGYIFENRGGSGVAKTWRSAQIQMVERDIILGLNIPHYPQAPDSAFRSGLSIGVEQPSFMPFHAFGPDQRSRACPVCKYGRYHGLILFVGAHADWNDVTRWLLFFESESQQRKNQLKAYLVYADADQYAEEKRRKFLEQIGQSLNLKHIALTFVPSPTDIESGMNKNVFHPDATNMLILFRNSLIVDKWVNLPYNEENKNRVITALDRTNGLFFNWPELKE